jgi:hypothetical protein
MIAARHDGPLRLPLVAEGGDRHPLGRDVLNSGLGVGQGRQQQQLEPRHGGGGECCLAAAVRLPGAACRRSPCLAPRARIGRVAAAQLQGCRGLLGGCSAAWRLHTQRLASCRVLRGPGLRGINARSAVAGWQRREPSST